MADHSSHPPPADKPPHRNHLLERGVKGSSPLGTALFIGLRAADPLLQYQILRHDWGARLISFLGSSTLPQGPAAVTNTPLDALGLSPYRLVLFSMAVGSALKQNYWLLALSYEKMPAGASLAIAAFNTVHNSVNNLLFIARATSASLNGESFPQTPLLVGLGLYVAGIAIETGSEVQRYRFKKDPKNKGKAYEEGLFGVVRHANYTGYLMWRVGYTVAAGGWLWGLLTGGFFFYNFTNSVKLLDEYCSEHYGAQWTAYKQKVPWRMIPYIY